MTANGIEAPVAQRCTLVLPSSGAFDSRAWRIATSLAARGHRVTVVARDDPGLPSREHDPAGYEVLRVAVSAAGGLPRPMRALARRRPRAKDAAHAMAVASPGRGPSRGLRGAIGAARRLAAIGLTVRSQRLASRRVAPPADLVHAMAYMGIPIGLDLGRRDRAPVVYDARDIYVDAANIARLPAPARRLFGWIERRWARRASRVVTINEPYARVMEDRFGVPMPLIVMNCSNPERRPSLAPRRFHAELDLPSTTRVVLYQGGFSPQRGIEQLIEALPEFPERTVLVFLGYGLLEAQLRALAAEPGSAGRLFVLPAVPPGQLLEWVSSADVVAMPIQPSTLNHRLTTPNKLFEAMAAGVPVVASDLPGMAGIVRDTGCGILCDPTSPVAIAGAVRSILDEPPTARAVRREQTLAAVRDRYNWDAQMEVLLAEYGRLTGRPW